MIKKILLTILTVFFFTNLVCANKLPDNNTVALLDFGLRSKTIFYSEELNAIAKRAPRFVRDFLTQDSRIELIDAEEVNSKLQATKFLLSDKLDNSNVKILGKELGCKYLLHGNVAFVTTRQEYKNIRKKQTNIGCPNPIYIDASVVLRVIDTVTCKIVYHGIGKGMYSYYYRGESDGINVGRTIVSKQAVKKAIEEASINAVDSLLKMFCSPR